MDREQLLSQWLGRRPPGACPAGISPTSRVAARWSLCPGTILRWCGEFLRPGVRLLDMGTGGGELLLTLGHPYELTSVTEGWEPNLALCQKKLAPLGITVKYYDSEKGVPLPFPDDSFDLVIDRHESLRPFGGPPGAEKKRLFCHPAGWAAKTTCPWSSGCARAFGAALWASTWKTSRPGSARRASG